MDKDKLVELAERFEAEFVEAAVDAQSGAAWARQYRAINRKRAIECAGIAAALRSHAPK